ncbi:hypothetical protein [Rufibacter roseus]|uniref:Uncharacterized protein n=1 Tax=Rufibacter roseus TaxID=1567108 RepID=A0ABW2DNW6_9BACT|nr:hypothetical protein [Rufibacter roseus]
MKVKALKTIAGYYGTIEAGKERSIAADVAKDLEKAGLVEIVDEETAPEEPKQGSDMTAAKTTKRKKK